MSQRSVGSCTRCTRANAFPGDRVITNMPKSGDAMAPPVPPGTISLWICCNQNVPENVTFFCICISFEDFWCHPCSTALVVGHDCLHITSSTKVTNFQHQALFNKQQIGRFEISVNNKKKVWLIIFYILSSFNTFSYWWENFTENNTIERLEQLCCKKWQNSFLFL